MPALLFFAFVSGLITIFAPCIWPLLPIILSSTATGGQRKPLGVTLGIITSFALFTLTLSYIIRIIPFDPNVLRLFAVVVIGFLGLSLLIPRLSALLEAYVSRLSGKFGGFGQNTTGFWGGFITGFSLGIVWTPCAGPILATIATLAATSAVNFQIVLVTLAYVIGVGIPLFIFATAGRVLFTKSRVLSAYTGRIQQVFGAIMILTALAIYTNYDKVLQANLLNAFPSYANFVLELEKNDAVTSELDTLRGGKKTALPQNMIDAAEQGVFNANTRAPEITGITTWLNTQKPVTISQLKGKVVLVDFWTYTCINCIRTLPYITRWYDKYKDDGFVVLGIHSPEFEFEKKTENVENAIQQYNIHYPVAQDNDFATWKAFSNQYWPAKYLIDKNGVIRYVHFGEGEYEKTEKAIQLLLKETGKDVDDDMVQLTDETPHQQLSPETYFGATRMEYYYPDGHLPTGTQTFTLAPIVPNNSFSFGGEWEVTDEYSASSKNAVLVYNFTAGKVFMTILPPKGGGEAVVYMDGKLVDAKKAGSDVKNGILRLDGERLYSIIDLKGNVENHTLKIEFKTPGVHIFTFTFG